MLEKMYEGNYRVDLIDVWAMTRENVLERLLCIHPIKTVFFFRG